MDKAVIDCIGCGRKLRIPSRYDELEVKCPSCGKSWILNGMEKSGVGMVFGAYMSELLSVEAALAKRELATLAELHKDVFVFLPGLKKSFNDFCALDGVIVNLDGVVSEMKEILGVHSRWIAKYKSLSSELTEQPALVDWVKYAKNYAESTAFKAMNATAHRGSPFFDSFNLAIEESKKQLNLRESQRQKNEEISRQRNHEFDVMENNLKTVIGERDAQVNLLKSEVLTKQKNLKEVFWYLCVSFVCCAAGLYALARENWFAVVLVVSFGCFGAALEVSGVKKS